ncbi:MAG: tetraacyldisaccharide 4'-kinase [Betaproteobacteria bacterium]
MASVRTRLQLALVEVWQRRGPIAWLLSPLSVLHCLGYSTRRALYGLGVLRQVRLDVPVVVIGNLYVGGTGKTPLTIELVRALASRGWRPGVVSRGYGGAGAAARLVQPGDTAREVGDEPLLIARASRVPVAVARSRAAAARLLRVRHPDCDVIVADDGLQHWPLARDMEIALLHYRGLGNGWLLPAGPLREPRGRLDEVDAIVCNGEVPAIRASAARYAMRARLGDARPLADGSAAHSLESLAAEQRHRRLRIVAAAGIGMPDRFFAMLRASGLVVEELPLADHFDFVANPFSDLVADRILITEKDAVKCIANPALAGDARIWVVPLATEIDPRLVDAVVMRLQDISRRTALGPSAA